MGIGKALKKVGKAIKKAVKKISKVTGVDKLIRTVGGAVKGAVEGFGKFMGKIGIIGQLAMMFILPGVGGLLMGAMPSVGAWGAGMVAAGQAAGGVMGALQAGVGHIAAYTASAVTTVGNTFANITKGVTDTLGNFAQTLGKKMGFNTGGASNFFGSGGADSAWNRSFGKSSRFQNLTMDYKQAGKLAKAAGEIAEEATINGVTLPEVLGKPPLTQEAIKTEALAQVAQDDLMAEWAAEKVIEDAATGSIALPETVMPAEGLPMKQALFDPVEIKLPEIQKPSLLEKVKALPSEMMEEIKKLPDKAIDYAKEAPERIVKEAIETPERAAKQYVSTRVQEEALKGAHGEGFRQAPATEVTYNSMNIPAIQTAIAPVEIQATDAPDYRNFATRISVDPNPYGNTAYQYHLGYQQYRQSLS